MLDVRRGHGPLVIIGAGGFAREALDVAESMGGFDFLGFLTDGRIDAQQLDARGERVLGPVSMLTSLPADVRHVIAIGDGGARHRIDDAHRGRTSATLIHASAVMGKGVSIAPGVILCAGALLTSDISVGRHTHINLGATVGHDAQLGDYVTVSPGVSISGRVSLSDQVTVGTRAALLPGVSVGAGTTVGAGAVVVRDLPAGVTAVGMPARPR